MPKIERSALLHHNRVDLYELINDVERYPEYMNGCTKVELISKSDAILEATLYLSKAGISQHFTTRNTLNPPESMSMELVDGPFKRFKGLWTFKALGDDACKVVLELDFEISNSLLGRAASKLFEYTANDMLDALVRRADQMLAKGN